MEAVKNNITNSWRFRDRNISERVRVGCDVKPSHAPYRKSPINYRNIKHSKMSAHFADPDEGWKVYRPTARNRQVFGMDDFNALSRAWKKETAHFSTLYHVTTNSNYLRIIKHGWQAVPYILKDLQKAPEHWYFALKLITEQDPVPIEDKSNIKKIREHWLNWGKAEGYL